MATWIGDEDYCITCHLPKGDGDCDVCCELALAQDDLAREEIENQREDDLARHNYYAEQMQQPDAMS